MLFLRLFIAMLAGLGGHKAYKPSLTFGPRWGSMLRYAIGFLILFPSFIVVKASIPKPQPDDFWGEVERDILGGFMAAGAVGTGTLLGHILDGHDK